MRKMRKSCSRPRLEQLLRIFRALQTSRVLHISMNAQLTHEPIVLTFSTRWKFFSLRDLFAYVMSVHNRNKKHARAIEFDWTNLLAML